MFKYLWIVIIALMAFCFIGYTVYCIVKAYRFTKDWPRALRRISDKHAWLCAMWFAVIVVVTATLFVVSLCTYLNALALE